MKRIYWILLASVLLIFGSGYTAAKFALEYSTPLAFALLRTGLGCAFTFPFSMYTLYRLRMPGVAKDKKRNSLPRDGRTLLYVVLFGLTSSTLFFGFWYAGESLVSASVSSVLVNTNTLFTVVFAYLFLRDKVSRMQVFGLILGFSGALLVASNGSLSSLRGDMLGFILLFLSAASFAGSLIVYKRFLSALEPITLNMLQLFFASAGLLIWILVSSPQSLSTVNFTPTFWVTILYTTIFGTVIANLIFMALVRQRGPTWFSMWLFLNPVTGVVISSLVLDQGLTFVQVIGMLIVVFSMYEISRAMQKSNNQKSSSELTQGELRE